MKCLVSNTCKLQVSVFSGVCSHWKHVLVFWWCPIEKLRFPPIPRDVGFSFVGFSFPDSEQHCKSTDRPCTNLKPKRHKRSNNLHAPIVFLSFLLPPRTMYCDETADECSGINVHQPTAFAHKLLQLSGVSFFWDEFPASAKSSPVCSATQLVKMNTLYKDVN